MKFSFPFFGKKSHSLDQEIADVLPKDELFVEEEKPSINWNAVEIEPMPGLELVPEQVEDKTSHFMTQAEESPKYSNQGHLAEGVETKSADDPLIVTAEPLKPLEIDDLQASQPWVMPESIVELEPDPTPEIASKPVLIEEPKQEEPKQEELIQEELIQPSAVIASPIPASIPEAVTSTPLLMTRQDVIAAYKLFLNRLPESFEVIQSRVNSSAEANLIDFSLADEFIKRPDLPAIIFPIAKKIVDAQAQEKSSTQATG